MSIPKPMKNLFLIPVLLLSVQCAEAQISTSEKGGLKPLQSVESVEIERYLGKWYELAKFPNWFERKCNESTAEYSLLSDGKIEVHNTCKLFKNGQLKDIFGVATVKNKKSNAKLSVTFLPKWLRWSGIGAGKYWVIILEPNYEYAVVSEPKREYLWILSRSPSMKRATYESIVEQLKEKQFDVSKLEFARENAIVD